MFFYSFNLLLLYEIEILFYFYLGFSPPFKKLVFLTCVPCMCLILQNILDTILLSLIKKKAPACKNLLL